MPNPEPPPEADPSGDIEGVRALRHRVLAGHLRHEMLSLAAALGHPAARAACEDAPATLDAGLDGLWGRAVALAAELDGAVPSPTLHDGDPGLAPLGDRAIGLWRAFGEEPLLRAAIAAARAALPVFVTAAPADARPEAALEAAERWFLEPSTEAAASCLTAASEALAAARGLSKRDTMPGHSPPRDAACAANQAAKLAHVLATIDATLVGDDDEGPCGEGDTHTTAGEDMPSPVELEAMRLRARSLPIRFAGSRAVRYAGGALGVPAVEAAIRAELVPWALGLGDPVRARRGAGPRSERARPD